MKRIPNSKSHTRRKYSYTLLLLLVVCLTACQSTTKTLDREQKTKSAQLHYQLGIEALRHRQLPQAFDELLLADKMTPNQANINAALALAWSMRGNSKKAEALFRKALRIQPSPDIMNNYGALLLQMKRPKEAEKLFRRAMDNPRYRRSSIASINLGDALLAQEKYNEALRSYEYARMLNHAHQELSRLRQAKAYQLQQEDDIAIALYQSVLQENPSSQEALQESVKLLRKQHKEHQAKLLIQDFMIANDKKPETKQWAMRLLQSSKP